MGETVFLGGGDVSSVGGAFKGSSAGVGGVVGAQPPVAPPSNEEWAKRPVAVLVSEPESPFDIQGLLRWLVSAGGSDLHLHADQVPRARVHGRLGPVDGAGAVPASKLGAVLRSMMGESQWADFERVHDVDFAFQLDQSSRFRVNAFKQRDRLGAVLRVIPTRIKTVDELELPETLQRLAGLPRGLVLVTGPTGSGKSTLLASLVDLANRSRRAHIVTIEDPVEFVHVPKLCSVTQREVGEDTVSFAAGLRAVLRQDPDIIMVGEMRDLETTRAALEAAETGHLVFATLHTKSAPETISRIINQFPDGVQNQIQATLAACLEAVVTQLLVPTKDGHGRVAAREVMFFEPSVRALIRAGRLDQLGSVLQTSAGRGMHSLDHSLAGLVNSGLVLLEDAQAVSANLDELDRKTRPKGLGGV